MRKPKEIKREPRGDDPLNCQLTPRLSYCTFFEDADRRGAEGQTQTFCATCARWRWADQRCPGFVAQEPQPKEEDFLT